MTAIIPLICKPLHNCNKNNRIAPQTQLSLRDYFLIHFVCTQLHLYIFQCIFVCNLIHYAFLLMVSCIIAYDTIPSPHNWSRRKSMLEFPAD